MNKRPTIVILTPGFPSDETDSTCMPAQQVFVKALKKSNPSFDIIVLAFQYPFEEKKYTWHGVNVITFNGRNRSRLNRLKLWWKIWRSLSVINKQHNVTGILSFWLGESAFIGKYFALKNNINHFSWILGQDARKGNRYVKYIKPKAGDLIALSDFIAMEFNRNYKVTPKHIIPVGIDPSMFGQTNNRTIDIMAAGSLIHLKQYDLFIEIISELAVKFPRLRCILCGEGEQKEKLLQRKHELGMDDKITMTGELPQQEVIRHMQRSKIFMHPSSYEGFGYVCAEALYAGCHVISFCRPMNKNIDHWHIVESKEEMIRKAIEILQDPLTEYTPVLFYAAEKSATAVMELF